jgi:hypothetical protein
VYAKTLPASGAMMQVPGKKMQQMNSDSYSEAPREHGQILGTGVRILVVHGVFTR